MRVLMLDSDRRLIGAVARALECEHVEVHGAESAEQAAEQLLTLSFDAFLIDCDVFDLRQFSSFAGVQVIATTSGVGAKLSPNERVLRKPFTSAQLLSALRESCGQPCLESRHLVDLLRRAHDVRRSFGLRVGEAELYMEDGEVVHAAWRSLCGEDALVEALSDVAREVQVMPARAVHRTIHRSFQALLMSVLSRLEERERSLAKRSVELASGVHPLEEPSS
jgi:DNA-binding NarL/FixJ family response regulator